VRVTQRDFLPHVCSLDAHVVHSALIVEREKVCVFVCVCVCVCVKGVICMVVVGSCSYVTRGVLTLVRSWLLTALPDHLRKRFG
jgi:hypothetical protein